MTLKTEEFNRCAPIKGTPAQWTGVGNHHRISESAATGWIDDFGSPVLKKLACESVLQNFSLAAAMERIFQAEERARVIRSDLFPQIDKALDSNRNQTVSPAGRNRSTRHNFGFDMSWEIDLWGRIRDLKDSQVAAMDAQYHAFQAAKLSLVANVLQAAFELVESEEQIKLAQRNLKSLQVNLEILDSKLEGGDADDRTALEISLSRSDVARARSTILAERRQADESKRFLETLLGRYPKGTIEALKKLPDPRKSVPVGMPSDLLLRRPDILEAEMQVNSALYNLKATEKQLLPSFRLTGGIGTTSSNQFKDLFDLNNLVWNIGQSLTQPVFHGGEILAEIRMSKHERDEVIAQYADVVLTAFREVEVALAAEHYYNLQVEALRQNVKEARLAESLSLSQYEKGLVDIITLLESQRRAFDAESSLLNIRLLRLINRVNLYLALGGDFETIPDCCVVATPVEAEKRKTLGEILFAPERP